MSETPKKWTRLTVNELRDELVSRGLTTTGRKQELVERLVASGKEGPNSDVKVNNEGTENSEDTRECVEGMESEETADAKVEEDIGEMMCVDEYQDQEAQDNGETNEDEADVKTEDVKDLAAEEADEEEEDISNNKKTQEEGQHEKVEMEGDQIEEQVEDQGDQKEAEQQPSESMAEDGELKEEADPGYDGEADVVVLDELEGSTEFEMEESQEKAAEEVKKAKTEEETIPEKKLYQPMKYAQFCNWVEQQNKKVKNEKSLFIKSVTGKDVMCTILYDWAKRATDFCIAYGKNGNGNALLSFLTNVDAEEARTALSKALGKDKVHQMTGYPESEIKEVLTVSFKTTDFANRSLVVQGIPSDASEEDICLYFPEAKLITHPVKKSDQRVELPEDIESHYYIEFQDTQTAWDAIKGSVNIKETYPKAIVKEMAMYLIEYKEFEAEVLSKIQKTQTSSHSNVFSDRERIEMCKAYRGLDGQIGIMKRDGASDAHFKKKIKRRKDLCEAIDADTDQRVKLGLVDFPENKTLMTSHTKSLLKKRFEKKFEGKNKGKTSTDRARTSTGEERSPRDKKEKKKSGDGAELDSSQGKDGLLSDVIDDVFLGSSRKRKAEEGEKEDYTPEVRDEISKLLPDDRGWFTISVFKEGNFIDREDLEKQFSKYGKVTNTNFTKKRGYIRFATKKEAIVALKNLFEEKDKWQPMVPTSNSKYLVLSGKDQPSETADKPATTPASEEQMLAAKAMRVTVTNIKEGTTVTTMRQLMIKFGPLGFVKMTKGLNNTLTAIVTYKDAESAGKALAAKHLKLDNQKLKLSPADTPRKERPKAQNTRTEDYENKADRQVFVGGVGPKSSVKVLRNYFTQFGEVEKAYIFQDDMGRSRGIALITFMTPNETCKAVKHQDHYLDGRTLHVTHQKGSKFLNEPSSRNQQGRSRRHSDQGRDQRNRDEGQRNQDRDQRNRDEGQRNQGRDQRNRSQGQRNESHSQGQQNQAQGQGDRNMPGNQGQTNATQNFQGANVIAPNMQGLGMQQPLATFPQAMMANTLNPQAAMLNTNLQGGNPFAMAQPMTGGQPLGGMFLGNQGLGLPAAGQMLPLGQAAVGQGMMMGGGMPVLPTVSTGEQMYGQADSLNLNRERLERKDRSRLDNSEEYTDPKRRRVGEGKDDSMVASVLKDISAVISSTISGLGPRGAKTTLTALQDALLSKQNVSQRAPPAPTQPSQSNPESLGSRAGLGAQFPGMLGGGGIGGGGLGGQEGLALQRQQAAIQQQQQQLLLHKQQEQSLQKELMELQKMKDAALREATGMKGYGNRM